MDKNYTHTVHVDLDGVICHMEGKIESILNCKIGDISRGKFWRTVEMYDRDVEPFFESLEKMADADELWIFVKEHFHDVRILSASGFVPRSAPEQKINWVRKHLDPHVPVKIVTKSPDKALHAHPTAILIDDRSKSIDPFVAAGGIGILHTSAKATIEELKKYL